MTLNKKKMVREIGRRTRIRNRDVQAVIEALIDVWTEELVSGGRIELENFFALRTRTIDLVEHRNTLMTHKASYGSRRQVHLRLSNKLRNRLKTVES